MDPIVDLAVRIFWVGMVVLGVSMALYWAEQRAKRIQAKQDKEGHP